MAEPDGVFLFIATYPDEASAQADYDVVKALHIVDAVGRFDAAVVTKDAKGKVHVNKDETSTRAGAWGGIAAGALLGLLFPPSILGSAAVLGAAGGFAGHLFGGMSRKDVKELGEFIDEGEAALLVIGDLTISEALEKAELRAEKQMRKQIKVDAKALDQEAAAAAAG
jgi:uncharacterized membrane protein